MERGDSWRGAVVTIRLMINRFNNMGHNIMINLFADRQAQCVLIVELPAFIHLPQTPA